MAVNIIKWGYLSSLCTLLWTRQQTTNLKSVLQDLYHDLKRRNAFFGFDEGKNEATGDESIHNIQQMENLFHFQQVFSLLGCQKEFREQLADESVTGNPEINKDIVMKLK